jgi:hypothetical protein
MNTFEIRHETKVSTRAISFAFAVAGFVTLAVLHIGGDVLAAESGKPGVVKPVASMGTGLLLEPPVDLSKFSHEEFVRISGSIGTNRINKQWTSAVVPLPARARAAVNGLTEVEVKDYMREARRLFNSGLAVPVSDVGLVSTQEDVIRRPMFNHVSVFSNEVAHVYLLVQKTIEGGGWGYFSIVQDRTVEPPINYFAEIKGAEVAMEAVSCYKCHASGPLAIHPTREDLVNDPAL